MPYIVRFDDEDFMVDEATNTKLEEEGFIEFCEECSSTFSAEHVSHPSPSSEIDDDELRDRLFEILADDDAG